MYSLLYIYSTSTDEDDERNRKGSNIKNVSKAKAARMKHEKQQPIVVQQLSSGLHIVSYRSVNINNKCTT